MRGHNRFISNLMVIVVVIGGGWLTQQLFAADSAHDAFTYQGQLKHNGEAVAGVVDLKFRLYDETDQQVGPELVAGGFDEFDENGRFTIDLAFGKGVFDGTALWLEIEVDGVTLAPRQPIMPTPYSVRALNVATVADGALSGTYTGQLNLNNAGNTFTGSFTGNGSGILSLNASNITSGIVGEEFLGGTYGNTVEFSSTSNLFLGTFSGTHTGSGAGLTSLNASNIASGNLNIARMPTGGNWSLSTNLNVAGASWVVNPSLGRIGIGTSTPRQHLSIGSDLDLYSGSTNSPTRPSVRGSGNDNLILSAVNDGDVYFNFDGGSGGVQFHGGAGVGLLMRLMPSGELGIGTPNPQELLHIRGGIGASWLVERNNGAQLRGTANLSDAAIGTANTAALRLLTNNTVRMNITPTGNVGIGTVGPSARLHVVGDLRIQDGTHAAGRILTSDAFGNASWQSGAPTYQIGDFAHGGIVFYVEPCGTKGLVAAKEDQSAGVRWFAGEEGNTQAKGDGPYAGRANTSIIIAAHVAIGDDGDTYAARICNELQITEGGQTYGDWYLPSMEELNQMWLNRSTIDATAIANGGSEFASAAYWSSLEIGNNTAVNQSFSTGSQVAGLKSNSARRVRAIRSF